MTPEEKILNQLAGFYGTDKSRLGYMKFYARHLGHLKDQPLRVLEIGVKGGASLRVWKDYFPNAIICGIDATPICKDMEEERVKIFIGDQGDSQFLSGVAKEAGPFDVIIDDCAHIAELQITSLTVLFPYLVQSGLYFIEDVHLTKQREDLVQFLTDKMKVLMKEKRDQLGAIESTSFYRPDSIGGLVCIQKREGKKWQNSRF